MLKIRVIGIEKGEYTNEFYFNGEEVFDQKEYQFEDEIEVNTHLVFNESQYRLKFEYYGELFLTCDRSAERYLEEIEGEHEVHFKITSEGINFIDKEDEGSFELEGNSIDITELVKQEMILAVPLKRVSPKYRDKEFSELHPEFTEKSETDEKENPAFSKLKKLNFN